MKLLSRRLAIVAAITTLAAVTVAPRGEANASEAAAAAAETVTVYTARHYDSDDAVYAAFTEATGIEVKLVEGKSDDLIARLRREGSLSPADIFMAVDAGRLTKAVEAGILAPHGSEALDAAIPAELRHPEGLWVGLSRRVRIFAVSNERVAAGDEPRTYEELADEAWKGRVLLRSSTNIYNQSLIASLLEHHGASTTEAWCRRVVENFARTPQGGDRDQVRAVAAGVGDVAVVNHYYVMRMLTGNEADKAAASKVRIVFPNQADRGAHVNISGAGIVRTAPNQANAVKLLEFLATAEAQTLFASGNAEYPAAKGVEPAKALAELGPFKTDAINASILGRRNRESVMTMDRAGWR